METTLRSARLVFILCLAFVILWVDEISSPHDVCCEPSDCDEFFDFPDFDSAKTTNLPEHEINLAFKKVSHHYLRAKCRGDSLENSLYYRIASTIADSAGLRHNSPFWGELLAYYSGLENDRLRIKLVADHLLLKGEFMAHSLKDSTILETERLFRRALRLFERIHDQRGVIDASYNLAYMYFSRSDYSGMEEFALRALQSAQSMNYRSKLGWFHWYIGISHQAKGRYDEAQTEFEKVLYFSDVLSDSQLTLQALARLGTIQWNRGELLDALRFTEDALELSLKREDAYTHLTCLITLGLIHTQLGDYSQAEKIYRRAFELNQRFGSQQLQSAIMNNWAELYSELGDWQGALSRYREAYDLEKRQALPSIDYIATFLSNIGLTQSKLGNAQEALQYQQMALKELEKTEGLESQAGLVNLRMGEILLQMGELDSARTCYELALSISEKLNEPFKELLSLLGLAQIHCEKNELQTALEMQRRALKMAQRAGSPEYQWRAHLEIGKTNEALGHYPQAQESYHAALGFAEASREELQQDTLRLSFFATKQEIYERLITYHLYIRNDIGSALGYSERSRSRILLDHLDRRFVWASVHNDTLLKEVQRLMPPEVQFVEYKILENEVVAWLIQKDTIRVVRQKIRKQVVSDRVEEFLSCIGARNSEEFQREFDRNADSLFARWDTLGQQLYANLFLPIDSCLSRQKVLYIIPDGVLHYLPFAALIVPGDGSPHPLLERYELATVPSLAVYAELVRRQGGSSTPGEKRMIAVGNPTGDLRASEREVRAIVKVFSNKSILLGAEVTKSALEALLRAGGDYFHFAGHYRINELHPLYGALLLATNSEAEAGGNASAVDGALSAAEATLTVQELLDFQSLKFEMAVLSSCESGAGALFEGEGVLGFSQALHSKGVRTLISSLAQVDDRVSAQLMERYYHYLISERLSRVEALRAAQLDFCRGNEKKYRFPYFWSSYILSGLHQ